MRRWGLRTILVILGGASPGCIEYFPGANGEPNGEPNPRPSTTQAQVVDRFLQETLPEVDVLYVVDNSPSMAEEQQLLADNFPLFLSVLEEANVNYHVGVISTDMGDTAHQGRLRQYSGRRYLDVDTENPATAFGAMAVLGAEGSADERGRDAIYQALTQHVDGYNHGFYRQSAALVIVPISDEDDHSVDVSIGEFIAWGEGMKSQPGWFRVSSIVSAAPVCATAAEVGTNYLALTNAFPGTISSVCSDRWDQLMVDLALDTAGLRSEFFLSQIPNVQTLEVQVNLDGVSMVFEPSEWSYDSARNSIAFIEFLPEEGAEILIAYES